MSTNDTVRMQAGILVIGYDPGNGVTLIVWTNLTVSLDDVPTANALILKVLDQIYTVSPLATPSPTTGASTDGE